MAAKYGEAWENLCIVFPSKRASVFFKEALFKQVQKPLFAPKIVALEEFVRELKPVTVQDNISLTFELYPIYKEHFPDEPFDKFYTWGSIMVQDFDELDQYLVDAEKLFVNLFELKEIDTTIEAWLNEDGKPSEFQARYLKFWESLKTFYVGLRKRLRDEKKASEGMLMRELAEELSSSPPKLKWEKVIFAGFNALTPAQETIMSALVDAGMAEWYWDIDSYFVDDPFQEAGQYFRKLERKRPLETWNWVDNDLATQPRNVEIIGVPRRAGQAKIAGLILREMAKNAELGHKTAVVLPDESLLFPLLRSLPEAVKDVNVTMGFPLRHTPLYTLIESVLQLHENADRLRPDGKNTVFYWRDVRNILRHPYLLRVMRRDSQEMVDEINKENLIYLSPKFFETRETQHKELLTFLFRPWSDLAFAIDWFLELFILIRNKLEDPETNRTPDIELEYLYHFHLLTQRMREKLEGYDLKFDLGTFRRLYREVIHSASIPFSGEPLKGLQIMGMLETRVLDFDRLIILSVNEGTLPSTSQQATFIPFNLRKAWNMPTQEDKDAVYGYHFYRLLKRAKDVRLLYNTEPDAMGSSEKSRYLIQLEAEWVMRNPHINLKTETRTFPMNRQKPLPLAVPKTAEALAALKAYAAEKGLSASAIANYLKCPLQFYFGNVLRIHEVEEAEEDVQANTFGTIVHAVLQHLYSPYIGQPMTPEIIDSLIPSIPAVVKDKFVAVTHSYNIEHGKNLLYRGVIQDLVTNLLAADKEDSPFTLESLESEYLVQVSIPHREVEIQLRGVIDRIDRKYNLRRIVDYKTGRFDKTTFKLAEWEKMRDMRNNREAFQVSFYAFLYKSLNKEAGDVMTGIYPLRKLEQGIRWLKFGATDADTFDESCQTEFEAEMIGILSEMFNPSIPFIQTEKEENCVFCPFKEICVRQ